MNYLKSQRYPFRLYLPYFDNEPETLLHYLFNCNQGEAIWNLIMGHTFGFMGEDNLIFMWFRDIIDKLGIVTPIAIWVIWCDRYEKKLMITI